MANAMNDFITAMPHATRCSRARLVEEMRLRKGAA
jgi:hypothetical protein